MKVDEVTSHNKEILSLCMRLDDTEKSIRKYFIESLLFEHIEKLAKNLKEFYLASNVVIQEITSRTRKILRKEFSRIGKPVKEICFIFFEKYK